MGGVRFLLKIPGGRVSRRGGAEGAGRVSAANWGFGGGGGLNIFFRGRNVHQDTDQTHPNLQRHTGVVPAATQEQTHPNLYPLTWDDRRLTYSNRAVQTRVCLELADGHRVFVFVRLCTVALRVFPPP